jgi:hypothetical protein
VIDSQPPLRLPLVHHLVQQRVLDLSPRVPGDVPPAEADLCRTTGLEVHRELAQTALHPTREPDRNFSEGSAEVLTVELAMERLEPVQ